MFFMGGAKNSRKQNSGSLHAENYFPGLTGSTLKVFGGWWVGG